MDGPANERLGGTREARRHELPDHYEQLEVSPRASLEVIQAAYRALVRTHHPDVNATTEAAQRIVLLNAAYRVLSEPEERARYDLECLRARRHERLTHPDHATQTRVLPNVARARALPIRSRPAVDDLRFPLVNGQVILGMLAVAVVAAIMLALLWATLDVSGEYVPARSATTVEWMRR